MNLFSRVQKTLLVSASNSAKLGFSFSCNAISLFLCATMYCTSSRSPIRTLDAALFIRLLGWEKKLAS